MFYNLKATNIVVEGQLHLISVEIISSMTRHLFYGSEPIGWHFLNLLNP
jgi:hypothetical protein